MGLRRHFYYKKQPVVDAGTGTTYVVQLFTGTTSWTAPASLKNGTIQLLVVGSGGAGGGSGGGGGAAETYYHSGYTVVAGNSYTVCIATGNTYVDGSALRPGWSSWFDTASGVVALGGGGGGIYGAVGGNGACGGGCGRDKIGAGGTGSKGYNGGAGTASSSSAGGGGGGMTQAGYAGSNPDSNNARTGYYSCGGSGISYASTFGTTDSNGYTIGDPANPGWFCGGGGGYWQADGNPSAAERTAGTKNPAWGGRGGGGFGVYALCAAYTQEEKNGKRHTGSGGGSGGHGGHGVIVIKYIA